MKDGYIQQVDTPQNLYEKPVNKFVAGFIGSPEMNFIDAVVKKEGEGATLEFAGFKIKLPKDKAKALLDGGYDGKTVEFGIRPEDIHDEEVFINNSPDTTFDATIKVYELLGAEVFLYFPVGDVEFTARVNPRTTARVGDTVKFALDLSKMHIFDKESGLAIAF